MSPRGRGFLPGWDAALAAPKRLGLEVLAEARWEDRETNARVAVLAAGDSDGIRCWFEWVSDALPEGRGYREFVIPSDDELQALLADLDRTLTTHGLTRTVEKPGRSARERSLHAARAVDRSRSRR